MNEKMDFTICFTGLSSARMCFGEKKTITSGKHHDRECRSYRNGATTKLMETALRDRAQSVLSSTRNLSCGIATIGELSCE